MFFCINAIRNATCPLPREQRTALPDRLLLRTQLRLRAGHRNTTRGFIFISNTSTSWQRQLGDNRQSTRPAGPAQLREEQGMLTAGAL